MRDIFKCGYFSFVIWKSDFGEYIEYSLRLKVEDVLL